VLSLISVTFHAVKKIEFFLLIKLVTGNSHLIVNTPLTRNFEVNIEINESISNLKDKIKDKKQITFHVDADQLDLWKIEISTIERKNEKLSKSEIDVTKLKGENLNSL
jgi:molecular chaperone DnaK (HSP70)